MFKRLCCLLCVLALAACSEEPTPTPISQTIPTDAPVVEANATATATSLPPTAVPTSTPTPTPTNTPTATPTPPKTLTVCMGRPPLDLYLYGDQGLAATAVRHALYENLITNVGYDYQARGVTQVPSLADGTARIETVTVNAGDLVLTAGGNVVNLREDITLINANGETIVFDGQTPVQMPQMTVDFTLQEMVWSDGEPVRAEDSVFSFQIAADPLTRGSSRFHVERTLRYRATDDRNLQWVGVPGWLDPDYFLNVWPPLPRHQLSQYTANDLNSLPQTTQTPLSNGAYVLESTAENQLILQKNPLYYRAGETQIDTITVYFSAEGQWPEPCDLLTQDAITLEQMASLSRDDVVRHATPSTIFEHIAMGINSYDEYGDDESRPDWFEEPELRQAIMLCTNRPRMIEELQFGYGQELHAYVTDEHPLYPQDAQKWEYDPATGNAILDGLGHIDFAGDGVRQNAQSGLPFIVTIGVEEGNPLRQRIVEMFAEDMNACGIQVNPYTLPPADWYADGPLGPLFGRQFDFAQFAWRTGTRPPCQLWLSTEVPGPEVLGFGGWGAFNVTGWQNETYDSACQLATSTLRGQPDYAVNHTAAIRLFTEQLPALPLFPRLKVAVSHPELQNFELDTTQNSEFWNVYEWNIPFDS